MKRNLLGALLLAASIASVEAQTFGGFLWYGTNENWESTNTIIIPAVFTNTASTLIPPIVIPLDIQNMATLEIWTLQIFQGASPLIRFNLLQNQSPWSPAFSEVQSSVSNFPTVGTFFGGLVMTQGLNIIIQWPLGGLTVQPSGGITGNGDLFTNNAIAFLWARNGQVAFNSYVSNVIPGTTSASTGGIARSGNVITVLFPTNGITGRTFTNSLGGIAGDILKVSGNARDGTNNFRVNLDSVATQRWQTASALSISNESEIVILQLATQNLEAADAAFDSRIGFIDGQLSLIDGESNAWTVAANSYVSNVVSGGTSGPTGSVTTVGNTVTINFPAGRLTYSTTVSIADLTNTVVFGVTFTNPPAVSITLEGVDEVASPIILSGSVTVSQLRYYVESTGPLITNGTAHILAIEKD